MAAAGTQGSTMNKKTFCLVTGASRGLGRGIAIKFAEKFKAGSLLVLVARDLAKLEETKSLISATCCGVKVSCQTVDLGKPNAESYEKLIAQVLADHKVSPTDFEQAIIVHNAGSLGNISKKTAAMDDVDEFRDYLDLNVTSVVCLNAKFLQAFSADKVKRRVVVNITSLASFHPFKSWGQYCTGKAARDMFFRVMAAEDPNVRVLSYAPGPLQTDMTIIARDKSADEELRKWFTDAYSEGKMLQVEFTAERLIEVLDADKFKNGDHVDVYDEIDEKIGVSVP